MPSGTPSASESLGQPLALTVAPAGVLGHLSSPSYTPSLSESVGQPRASTVAPSGVSGQAPFLSGAPSLSEAGGRPPPRGKTQRPGGPTTRVAAGDPPADLGPGPS